METNLFAETRDAAEKEIAEASKRITSLAENGKMLEIRKSSKTDDEFLDALATAADTSRDIIDWIAMYTFLPIARYGYAADFDYSRLE